MLCSGWRKRTGSKKRRVSCDVVVPFSIRLTTSGHSARAVAYTRRVVHLRRVHACHSRPRQYSELFLACVNVPLISLTGIPSWTWKRCDSIPLHSRCRDYHRKHIESDSIHTALSTCRGLLMIGKHFLTKCSSHKLLTHPRERTGRHSYSLLCSTLTSYSRYSDNDAVLTSQTSVCLH